MPNLVNNSPTGGQITESLQKSLKTMEKNNFLINYFRKPNSLITIFTWPVDRESQENHCKSPLLIYGCTSQGVKHPLFFG